MSFLNKWNEGYDQGYEDGYHNRGNDDRLAAAAEAQLADEFKAERDRLLNAEALQYAVDYPDLMNRLDELEAFVRDVAAPGRVYAEVRSERQQFDAVVAERRRLRDRAQALLDEEEGCAGDVCADTEGHRATSEPGEGVDLIDYDSYHKGWTDGHNRANAELKAAIHDARTNLRLGHTFAADDILHAALSDTEEDR